MARRIVSYCNDKCIRRLQSESWCPGMNREFHDELPSGVAAAGPVGRRVALVIGNGRYSQAGILKNPANDAAGMAKALEALGFEVVGGAENGIDLRHLA